MLLKCQQVFALAHKDIQRLTWNFHTWELSRKKMVSANEAAHCSWKVPKVEKTLGSQEEDLFSVR